MTTRKTIALTQWTFVGKIMSPHFNMLSSVQFSCSVCPTLWDPMNRSVPGLPVHHQLPEFTQTHVHQVGDAIQPLILCHPLLSAPKSLPASGSFQMNQLFALGGPSIGVSASILCLLMNIQDWFPLQWMSWISLQSKELLRIFSNTTVQKHQFFKFQLSTFFIVQLPHPYMTTRKTIALIRQTFVGKVMFLLLNMLSSWS